MQDHFESSICSRSSDVGIDGSGQKGDDSHDGIISEAQGRHAARDAMAADDVIELALQIGVLDGHPDEMRNTLLLGLGPDILRHLVPVVLVRLQRLEQQQCLVLGPSLRDGTLAEDVPSLKVIAGHPHREVPAGKARQAVHDRRRPRCQVRLVHRVVPGPRAVGPASRAREAHLRAGGGGA